MGSPFLANCGFQPLLPHHGVLPCPPNCGEAGLHPASLLLANNQLGQHQATSALAPFVKGLFPLGSG